MDAGADPVGSVGKIDVSFASRLCVSLTILAFEDATQAASPLCRGFSATSICSRFSTPRRKTNSSSAVHAFAHAAGLLSAAANTCKCT